MFLYRVTTGMTDIPSTTKMLHLIQTSYSIRPLLHKDRICMTESYST